MIGHPPTAVVAIEDTSEQWGFGTEITLTLANAAQIRIKSTKAEGATKDRDAILVRPNGDEIKSSLPGLSPEDATVELMAALLDAHYDRAELPDVYVEMFDELAIDIEI